MAKVQLSLEGKLLAEYPLDKERMTVGRRSRCDVHIDNMAISGEHAAIVTIGNDSFLEDLESTNGTKVNGKPIKKYVLQHRDVIELGKYQLTYVNENQPSLESALTRVPLRKMEALMQASKATQSSAATKRKIDTEATQPIAPMKFGRLKMLDGEDAGKVVSLNRSLLTLGKSGEQLAVVTRRAEGYFLTHVEGEQQPVVNQKPIGLQAYQLSDQDVIEVAGSKMLFYYQ
jgi:hypothetical protein